MASIYPYTYTTTGSNYSGLAGAGQPTGKYTINTGAGMGGMNGMTGNVTINNGGSGWVNSNLTTGGNLTGTGLHVTNDAEFEGDVTIKGKSLSEWMATMEKRLAILVPDPAKLEKFEALQKAYNHYKLLEALCHEEKKND